ncbi:MAG: cell envelope integrity protein TolA, partial [Thiohalophilus sp.]
EEARKAREAEEQKRREEEARKAREAEEQKRREQELQAEQEAKARAQARREFLAKHEDEINQFENRIKNRIIRHWRLPATADSGMRCEIMVRLLPGGDVASVRITRSSGDAAFDRSVENAVYSAAPLPVPGVDSGLFDEFREIKFVFAPEDKR